MSQRPVMDSDPPLSTLCRVCQHINFNAILTPREWEQSLDWRVTTYRPELIGNGRDPGMDWGDYGKGKHRSFLGLPTPAIRDVHYDELSLSEDEEEDVFDVPRPSHNDAPMDVDDEHDDQPGAFADGLSDISDDDDKQEDEDDNDDDIGEISDSDWSGDSHLTETTRIDLELQEKGNWAYRNSLLYYLGTIWDVRKRRHECDLCGYLWTRTRKNEVIRTHYLFKTRCILKLMEFKGRWHESGQEVTMLNLVYIYAYKLEPPGTCNWTVKLACKLQGTHKDVCAQVDQTGNGTVAFDDRFYGEARLRPGKCNFNLLRSWLKLCENGHDHAVMSIDGELKIRLIDVQRSCLIEWSGQVADTPRFVALSYVWGSKTLKEALTHSRLDEFKQPKFFDRPLDQTIRDAIDVVRGIGEKYLWVDNLCILQDSAEDKDYQIPQMHQIYGRAVVTIIAASGKNSEAGLSRVSSTGHGNLFSLNLKDIRIITRTGPGMQNLHAEAVFVENYLADSVYMSRGWTFQESLLSTRALIFTTHQVYFECERCTWCEETHWESNTIDFTHMRSIKGAKPWDEWLDEFDRRAYEGDFEDSSPKDPKAPPAQNPLSYGAVVKNYTGRKLTHDKDILRACLGVLNVIKAEEDTDFLWALRTKHFGNDLLFGYKGILPPRFPDESAEKSEFPSWSWLSWKGTIEIANQARGTSWDPVTNLVECDGVKCYTLKTKPNGENELTVINPTGGWRFHTGYHRIGEGISDHAIPSISELYSPAIHESGIPSHPQNLDITSLHPLASYHHLKPNFHIIFQTYTCLALLSTHLNRRGEITKRELYACRWSDHGNDASHDKGYTGSFVSDSTLISSDPEPAASKVGNVKCPCHDRDIILLDCPEGANTGPFLGELPAYPATVQGMDYFHLVPDGVYKLVWMNNNQLPTWGSILCKPVKDQTHWKHGWPGEILQRVSVVASLTRVHYRAIQDKYNIRWDTVILG